MTYTMSKNYDALYDLLCGGGEALGKTHHDNGKVVGSVFLAIDTVPCGRENLIAWCTRLSLEWLAPADIAEIIEKGDQAIRMWHEELKADGWDSSTSLDLASGDWTTATAKHRTA